jgi:hypothetical protein
MTELNKPSIFAWIVGLLITVTVGLAILVGMSWHLGGMPN